MKIISDMTAKSYVEKSVAPLKTLFKDYNFDDQQSYMVGKNIWGDIPPDTLVWGYDPDSHTLGPEAFQDEVLNTIAKSLYPIEKKIDNPDDFIQKAMTSISETVLIPTHIDPRMIDLVKRDAPFLAMLPKKTMIGKIVNVPRRTGGIVPEFLTDSAGTINIVDQSYTSVTGTVKFMYASGQITGPARATTRDTLNLKQAVIKHTFMDFQRHKESFLLRGRITSGTEAWAGSYITNDKGYDGLFKRVHEDYSANETELNGNGAIGIGDVDNAIETLLTNGGKPDYGIGDFNTLSVLMQEARTHTRLFQGQSDLGTAIGRIKINELEIYGTNQLLATPGNKSLAIGDLRAMELRTLLPDTFVEVGQNRNDSEEFYWKVYETPIITAPEWLVTVNGGQ